MTQKIEDLKAKEEAERLKLERQAEERRIAAEKAAEKRKKIATIVTSIAVACIAFVTVLTKVIIPNSKYNAAVALIKKGDIINAYESLVALNGYKDSTQKENEIFSQYIMAKLKAAAVSDVVYFGAYEQDNNTSDGKEKIEWIILEKEGNKALVVSKYALDCQQYNTINTSVTWETCFLREWLNETFLYAAFSESERAMIPSVTVSADKNPYYSTSPGNSTADQVFLLSVTEANKYFGSDRTRQCQGTAYCYAQGAHKSDNGNCRWWLRTPGFEFKKVACVCDDGSVFYYGFDVGSVYAYGGNFINSYGSPGGSDRGAVRPALWIDFGS